MPDEQLNILIRTLADTYGAKQVEDSLRGVTKATNESTDATKETEKQSGKAEVAHHAWAAAIRQLHREFPILSRLAHAALNPIVFSLALVSLGFELWRKRVEEAKATLSGLALPDLKPPDTEPVGQVEKAWIGVLEAVRQVNIEMSSVNQQFKDYEKFTTDKQAAERRRAEALEADAAAKLQAASRMKIATAEEDKATLDEMKAQADAAKAAKAEAQKRREEIINFQGGAMDVQQKAAFLRDFYMRYGVGMTGTEAMKLEEAKIAEAGAVERRYQERLRQQPERAKVQEERRALEQEAAKEQAEAARIRRTLPVAEAGTSLEKAGGVATIVAAGSEALKVLHEGGRLSASQVQALQALRTMLEGIHANNRTMMGFIEGAYGNVQELARRVQIIRQRQDAIAKSLGLI